MASKRLQDSRRLRRLRTLPVLPTLLTAGNLASGITAIMCAAHDMLGLGAALVFFAMFCDLFDGKVARMTGTDGAFGAELDSLADVVSFGAAPAMLMHRLVLGESGVWGDGERLIWLVSVVYAVFTAIRLARYNVEKGDGASSMFKGLPSPGAAAVLCSWILLYGFLAHEYEPGKFHFDQSILAGYLTIDYFRSVLGLLLMPIGLLMAVLMVSNVPFPHLGNTLLSGSMRFRALVLVILILGSLVVWHVWALALVTTAYVLLSLIPGLRSVLREWAKGRRILIDESELEDDLSAEDAPRA
jgi:CDP-diacylglycerol--serine O-phosphatidyltransferase